MAKRLSAETKASAIEMLKAGTYVVDVANALGISWSKVKELATANGIVPARCATGSRFGRREALRKSQVTETNWRAVASNARWGYQLGR